MQLSRKIIEKKNRALIQLNLSTPITCAGEYEWTSTVRSDWITHSKRPTAEYGEFASFICGFKRLMILPPRKVARKINGMVYRANYYQNQRKSIALRIFRQFAKTTMIKSRVYSNKSQGFILYFLFRRAETLTYAVRHHFPRHAPHPGILEPTLAPSFPETVFLIHQAKIRTTTVFASTKVWFLHDSWLLRYRRFKYRREGKGFYADETGVTAGGSL